MCSIMPLTYSELPPWAAIFAITTGNNFEKSAYDSGPFSGLMKAVHCHSFSHRTSTKSDAGPLTTPITIREYLESS